MFGVDAWLSGDVRPAAGRCFGAVDERRTARLFEPADLILAVGRHIQASKEAAAEYGTPLEGAVMRFIDRHPGTTPAAAAEVTRLTTRTRSPSGREMHIARSTKAADPSFRIKFGRRRFE